MINTHNPTVCDTGKSATPLSMLEVVPVAIRDASGTPWVGLAPQHYENLSINMQSLLTFIKEQKSITTYLKECIRDADNFNDKPDSYDGDQSVHDNQAVERGVPK